LLVVAEVVEDRNPVIKVVAVALADLELLTAQVVAVVLLNHNFL
jgi:hypothetical protein